MSCTTSARHRWRVVYPLGRADAVRAMGTVAAPLLAGFGLATVAVLITAERQPPLAEAAITAFTMGSILFVFSIQFTGASLLYAATPAERVAWEAGAEPGNGVATVRAVKLQHKDMWLADRYFQRARCAYDVGILAHLSGLAVLLVPGAVNGGQWAAVGVVLLAIVFEAIWITSLYHGRGPKWFVPSYRHARMALHSEVE